MVRSSRRQKANKLKLVKQWGVQASKIKALRFEMFLKRRHSAPIIHYAVNFIGRGHSGKFKAWFHGKKALEFSFFGLNTVLDVIEIPKPQKTCCRYRHFKHFYKSVIGIRIPIWFSMWTFLLAPLLCKIHNQMVASCSWQPVILHHRSSMLVCSVIDHRWRQNVITTEMGMRFVWRVYHRCSYYILTTSVIYYWTDAQQHW